MFYFIFVFLLVSIFLLLNDGGSQATKYMILTMAAYTIALFSMMFYLSKDTYYYNTVYNYFSLPHSLWKFMMFSPVNRNALIAVMNLFSLAVLYLGVCFSLSLLIDHHPRPINNIKLSVLIFLILEYLFYLPCVTKALYYLLYPNWVTSASFYRLTDIIHVITIVSNFFIILISIVLLIYSYYKASPLKMIRLNILSIGFCYTLIMVSYLFIFGTSPQILIRVSKLADTINYNSIPLNRNNLISNLFPYYLIITFALIGYSIYKLSNTNHKIIQQTFSLSKEIAASDTTSKVFCHYMKNELLAIMSEVDTLPVTNTDDCLKKDLLDRCENLYTRLDLIHKSTKTSALILTEVHLLNYIKECCSHLSYNRNEYKIIIRSSHSGLNAMLDTNYFEQALHNIFTNALEAMETVSPDRKKIIVTIQPVNNRISIFIEDFGIGISKENLPKVFEPFYSSRPVAKHWGMGLSLTHKIISAHEGHIEVESELDHGTTFKIILPQIIYPKN